MPQQLNLDKKFASATVDETVLLHKRPYDFRRERRGAPSCTSIMSNETAYFRNQFNLQERLDFDLEQDLIFKFCRSSEGHRLNSTKSCAVELGQSLFHETSAEFEKTKENSKPQD